MRRSEEFYSVIFTIDPQVSFDLPLSTKIIVDLLLHKAILMFFGWKSDDIKFFFLFLHSFRIFFNVSHILIILIWFWSRIIIPASAYSHQIPDGYIWGLCSRKSSQIPKKQYLRLPQKCRGCCRISPVHTHNPIQIHPIPR